MGDRIRRALGEGEGHPFHGNQWTGGGGVTEPAARTIESELTKFQADPANSRSEISAAINRTTGEIIFRNDVPYIDPVELRAGTGVDDAIYHKEMAEAGDENVLHYHTHPDDNAFSDGDWKVLAWSHVGEMRVVTNDHIYTLTKTPKFNEVPWQQRTPAAMQKRWNDLSDELWDKTYAEHGEGSVSGMVAELTRRINQKMSDEFGVTFSERPKTAKRSAGEGEGHPFHGNQWTEGSGHGVFPGSAANVKKSPTEPGEWHVTFPDGRQYSIYKDASSGLGQWEVVGLAHGAGLGAPFTKKEMLDNLGKLNENKPFIDVHSGRRSGKTLGEHLAVERARTKYRIAADDYSLPFHFDNRDPRSIAWAKEHALELADGIADTTADDIRAAIADALESGEGIEDLADVIAEAIGDDDRAEMIARTEIMAAANEGQREGWQQAQENGLLDDGSERVWIATEIGACPDCEELDGTRTSLDGTYEYQGDDIDGPPAHPNCRCTEGIVAAED